MKMLLITIAVVGILYYAGLLNDKGEKLFEDSRDKVFEVAKNVKIDDQHIIDMSLMDIYHSLSTKLKDGNIERHSDGSVQIQLNGNEVIYNSTTGIVEILQTGDEKSSQEILNIFGNN
ncbi:hypothetical protein ACSVDA_24405 [Cytobacillus sp. Hm23]